MIDKNAIEKRIVVLDEDIAKVQQNIKNLDQQKTETIGMLNALTGAKQQCQSFLQEFSNDEPEASDSSDVE
jgi:prephenate dehydratase